MTRNLVTLSPEASVAEALTLCRKRRIRHIPIVEEGRLVGIVSDRDLRDASPALGNAERASTLQEIRVGDVMTREVSTADPQDPIENVAQEMYELKIGRDRKSTRLNSSHANISYAVFCLKKKKKNTTNR